MTRGETKERILRACVRTLAEHGHRGTTARSIARTGGFAPGVIYYHFADLDDLFVATLHHSSRARLARYRAELLGPAPAPPDGAATGGRDGAVRTVRRLRALYAEDTATGHIAAVQELVAAAGASPRLAEQVRVETGAWQELGEATIDSLVAGVPFRRLVPVRELAGAAVAGYLGMEMLAHLDAGQVRPDTLFDAAERAATLLDRLRLRRPSAR